MTPAEAEVHSAMQSERRHLGSLAYRLLAALTDVEAAVQAAYIQWYRLTAEERDVIEDPRAWLTRAVSRVCLHMLASAHRTHARMQWAEAGGSTVPENESMTPAERVAFVLHDDFAMTFTEIAEVVGQTPETCRRLTIAARRQVAVSRSLRVARAERDEIVRAFIDAARRGNAAELVSLLDPRAKVRADPDRCAVAGRRPTIGARRVARYLLRPLQAHPDTTILEQETPDGLGFALWEDGCIVAVANLDVSEGAATAVRLVTIPHKLTLWG